MRGLTSAAHWTFQTVEWSRKVASVHHEIQHHSHFILPSLPDVITPPLQEAYFGATNTTTRIVTAAACQHTRATLEQWIHDQSKETETFLVVGGNDKNSTSLSTTEAIQTAKRATSHNIWAVANPNDKTSIGRVHEKLQAGATGIITQPLLSSCAMDILHEYPRHSDITYLCGLAMPQTQNGLHFWLTLLEQPELEHDSLFQHHVDYFSSREHIDSLAWSRRQLETLATDANVDGIHYMPVHNTQDLLLLLGDVSTKD
jgi:5,10-methylenetetrahydrofolate reductase